MTLRRAGSSAALAAVLVGASAFAGAPTVHAATATKAPADSVARGRKGESSLGILFGVGWYDNSDFNTDLVLNGIPPIENGFEYGLQYRKRVSRWFSLGGEVGRMDGRTNPLDGTNSEFGIAGTPVLVDVFVHPATAGSVAFTLFGGIGPLVGTRLSFSYPDGSYIDGRKTGLCMQAGGEGELRFGPNFGFFVRGLFRRAGANDVVIDDGSGLVARYDVDFDGGAVTFGPRWYFGN